MTHPGTGTGKTFVLVHGSWGGGWTWKFVAAHLRERGHIVHAPTLTGLGERSHLLREDISLSTHILDVVNFIKWSDLEGAGITLVGHSYGGMVISGVVEGVAQGSVDSLVYLDAAVPEDGESAFSHNGLETEGLPTCFTIREGAGEDLPEAIRSWARSKLTPQPMATCVEPVRLTGARDKIRVKTFVRATQNDRSPVLDRTAAFARAASDWFYEELDCAHSTQLLMPRETAEILERAAMR